MRLEVLNYTVHRRTGWNHQQDPPRFLQRGHKCAGRVDADDFLSSGWAINKSFRFGTVQIITGHREAVAFHVQGQIVTHYTQSNDTDLRTHTYLLSPSDGVRTRKSCDFIYPDP